MQKQTIDGVPRHLIDLATGASGLAKAMACKELRALLDAETAPCAHEWTDDGAHLLVCTACGAQEDHDPAWRDMGTAPTDGTMVRLLVEFDEHSTEDAEQAITIGANNLDNDEEDAWRFAGWCWSHDHFTEGKGTPVGWLPMLDDPVSKPAKPPAVATIDLGKKEVGNYGSLYDGPSVRRAYTYTHQPGNQEAYQIGIAACSVGMGGDAMDKGLGLLKQLELAGYGVFKV